MNRSYLPVPEIREDLVYQHSVKQGTKKESSQRLKKPPKLKPRHHDSLINRSQNSLSAHAISFRDRESSSINQEIHSPMYNKSSTESYFDQCFHAISKIGEGSFGEVFKVRSKEDGFYYAIKKSKQFFRSENYRAERLEEVRRYEQFSEHDNCVTLYKAWEQDDRLYMQMELCQESLDQYLIRAKVVPEEKIWSVLLDLLLALKSMHDKNLIHLDIKLDNILVGDDGLCKLADFGLVIDIDRANQFQATEGDSRYIAPELMQGHFSKAADVFSLGIALLELTCNLELPSNGPLWQQLRSGILPDDLIKQVSGELQDIIKHMINPSPFLRPTVGQLLTHKRLSNLLKIRRRWNFFKGIQQTYRKTKRYLWLQMCNLNIIFYRLFAWITIVLKLKDPDESRTPHTSDSLSESYLDVSDLQGSPSATFSENENKIVNSTPLNSHHLSFRSRKDLTKTSFRNDSSMNRSDHLFLDDLDVHRTSSFVKNAHESSSLRGKKLFLKRDEFDSD